MSPSLEALRAQVRALETGVAAPRVVPLGVPVLDAWLPGGGLTLAALHQVEGARDEWDDGPAAGFCLALAAPLIAALDRPLLWVARQADLHGPGLAAMGLDPGGLILVQADGDREVLWAMEEGLRCGALAGVAGEVAELTPTAGRRLQLAAEASLDAAAPETMGVTAFALHRRFRPPRRDRAASAALSRWRITAAASRDELGPPFIGRPRWRLDLLRCRGAAPGSWQVEWDDAACGFSLAAALRDGPLAAESKPCGQEAAGALLAFRRSA